MIYLKIHPPHPPHPNKEKKNKNKWAFLAAKKKLPFQTQKQVDYFLIKTDQNKGEETTRTDIVDRRVRPPPPSIRPKYAKLIFIYR